MARNRDEGAVVIDIKGIKFVDFTYGEHEPNGMTEIRQQAMNVIRDNAQQLKEKGIRRVEFDSYGGYYFRKVPTKGRFVPVSTMHLLRMMKR